MIYYIINIGEKGLWDLQVFQSTILKINIGEKIAPEQKQSKNI